MARPEKVQAVAEIKERIEGASAVFLTEYRGIPVKDMAELRRSLRQAEAEYKVVKMTLARRAADELGLEGISEQLVGPTGLTFVDGDAVAAAKALREFAKTHEALVIKAGLLADALLTPEGIDQLADVEPREVLLAKIVGAAKAPLAGLAGLLSSFNRNTASMLSQLLEKKEGGEFVGESSDAPAEDPARDESVAEEADDGADAPEADSEDADANDTETAAEEAEEE